MNSMHIWLLLGAYAFDILWGDPPNRWHPVAWMGQIIGQARRYAPFRNRLRFIYGMTFVGSCCLLLGALGWLLQQACDGLPWYVVAPIYVWVLKSTFSTRTLHAAAIAVWKSLKADELAQARYQLSYHLVSRDTSKLNESQVSAAVIESISENTSDSVVAPLFFFCLAGLPGALIYRFVNTCDAMWGYRTPEFEWLGKFAARFDDALNWLPARLTSWLMIVAAVLSGKDSGRGLRVWLRDRRLTASPNAGQPMSAAAGILGVELEKVGYYVLGKGLEKPDHQHIRQSLQLLWWTSVLAFVLAETALYIQSWLVL